MHSQCNIFLSQVVRYVRIPSAEIRTVSFDLGRQDTCYKKMNRIDLCVEPCGSKKMEPEPLEPVPSNFRDYRALFMGSTKSGVQPKKCSKSSSL